MYLTDGDLEDAVKEGRLICEPTPSRFDANSIDLTLDNIKEAKIWNVDAFAKRERAAGRSRPELRIANYRLGDFGGEYLINPPMDDETKLPPVARRDSDIIVRPQGFLLWQTREVVGTPEENAEFICFVEGKSTRARTGILVHFTAPTIHCSWKGKITLEIANLGPFDIVLRAGDCIAQLTVARVTNPPRKCVRENSVTLGQGSVIGNPSK